MSFNFTYIVKNHQKGKPLKNLCGFTITTADFFFGLVYDIINLCAQDIYMSIDIVRQVLVLYINIMIYLLYPGGVGFNQSKKKFFSLFTVNFL